MSAMMQPSRPRRRSQAEEELAVFKQFYATQPSLAEYSYEGRKPPEADILLSNGESRIGVELTEVFNDPSQVGGSRLKKQESETDQIISLARMKFEKFSILPVIVRIGWIHDIAKLSIEKRKETIAENIAMVVDEFAKPNVDLWIDWRQLWPQPIGLREVGQGLREIDHMTIRGNRSAYTRSHWSATDGGAVGPISAAALWERLQSKEPKYEAIRQTCDEAWLLIHSSGDRMSSMNLFDESAILLANESFHSSFERVFYFDLFSRGVIELCRDMASAPK